MAGILPNGIAGVYRDQLVGSGTLTSKINIGNGMLIIQDSYSNSRCSLVHISGNTLNYVRDDNIGIPLSALSISNGKLIVSAGKTIVLTIAYIAL